MRVFELGRVFLRDASVATTDSTVKGIHQPMRVAGLAYGDADGLQWARKARRVDFYDVKGDVEALLSPRKAAVRAGRASGPASGPLRAACWLDGREIGVVGELHPRWRQSWELAHAPVLFELDLDAVVSPAGRRLRAGAQVPAGAARHRRDRGRHRHPRRAAWRPCIRPHTGGLLREALLFDVYKPKQAARRGWRRADEKSLAVRLTLASSEATLTDEQIDAAVKAVVDRIAGQLGGRLRG